MLRPGLVAALLLAVAGPAAGELSLAVSQPEGALAPESASTPVTATVTVDCQTLTLRADDPDNEVAFTIDAPPYVQVTGPLQGIVTAGQCSGPSGSATLAKEFQVTVTREAPGMQPLPVRLGVELSGHATDALLDPQRTANASFTVMALPYFLVEPRVVQKLVRVENDTATVTIEVTNHGNVRTKVVATAVVAQPPQGTLDGAEIVLESPNSGDQQGAISGNLHLTFHAPPGDWGQIAFRIDLASSAVDDPGAVGQPLAANVLFTNGDGGDRKAPLPAPPLLGLALGLVAVMLRRRA